jgi:hypothetical protein
VPQQRYEAFTRLRQKQFWLMFPKDPRPHKRMAQTTTIGCSCKECRNRARIRPPATRQNCTVLHVSAIVILLPHRLIFIASSSSNTSTSGARLLRTNQRPFRPHSHPSCTLSPTLFPLLRPWIFLFFFDIVHTFRSLLLYRRCRRS